ncbi:unnamed protein product [Euphydryas editha]|uniref:ISXO2-like transposase domain-containing protein n=1 Tax=Euphydryas editha TaxID=104508 RepID=A0AAU9TDP9_EUPED|nr:unnamed protein product [Euphydryas editha]
MSASEDSQPSTSCSEVNNLEPRQSTSSDEPPAKRYLYVSEIKEMWNLVKVFRKLGTREQAIAFAEERGMIPQKSIVNYKIYQIEKQTFDGKIGGPGKIVQIDESKFGKRKYNKGQRIEGHWVLGMIEDGSEDLRLEICPDNVRSADVYIPLIKKHVSEGTIIHTDMWRAYNDLENHGFTHRRVNHSDP